ncbi:hypothetical protein Esti_005711 [Eimeria stiedai]
MRGTGWCVLSLSVPAAVCLCFAGVLPFAAGEGTDAAAAADTPELEIEWPGRVVAVGDLHGDAENALLLLDALEVVDKKTKKWKGGSTLLVQTGDIVDRGPDGKVLYDLFEGWKRQAQAAGGKVVTLLGNHDAMNICGDFRYVHPRETTQFGGLSSRRLAFSEHGHYGALLLSLASAVRINGMIFSHAGVTPAFAGLGLRGLHELLSAELRGGCSLHYKKHRGYSPESLFATGDDGPLWTRLYTLSPSHEGCPALTKALLLLQADVMVVGHTVQESLSVETRCGGRLIAIDTGVSRYVANSPRGIEVTSSGVFYEVAVHPTAIEEDDESTGSKNPPSKRRLKVHMPRFYRDKSRSKIEGARKPAEMLTTEETEDARVLTMDTEEL